MKLLITVHARPLLAAAGLALCGAASGAPPASGDLPPAASPTADFSRPLNAEISSPAVLRSYLLTQDEVRGSRYANRTNRFCFVKQAPRERLPGDTASVWMIWREGGVILNGPGIAHTPEDAAFAGRSAALTKSVNLATDVVETEEQIAGSTFLVDRAWVNHLVTACQTTGRTVTLAPRRRDKG